MLFHEFWQLDAGSEMAVFNFDICILDSENLKLKHS
jgi:hypothetical protein